MSFFEKAFVIFSLGTFGLMFYSVIRWIAVFLSDRSDIARRKKYAIMCLISIVIIILVMAVSFIVSIQKNSM